MLFMVACLFRARGLFVYCRRLAVHAGCCSGFLRELELGRLYWSPPAARAGPGAWVMSPKASLLVGGALCLTYGCVFDRGRAQLVASALPTLAVRRTSHLLRLIHRACDLSLPRNRCVASYIFCRALAVKTSARGAPVAAAASIALQKKQHAQGRSADPITLSTS